MNKINEIKNDFNKNSQEINKRKENELNELDLKTLEAIISRDNTDPEFIIIFIRFIYHVV